MSYFNYHATARRLIEQGRLVGWYYTERHNAVCPALVLCFNDLAHPVMPIRQHRWADYEPLLPAAQKLAPPEQGGGPKKQH